MSQARPGGPRTQFAKRLQDWAKQNGVTRKDLESATKYRSAHVGNVMRGDSPPSHEFVSRLISHYQLPAAEWWRAAGYNPETLEPVDQVDVAIEKTVRRLEWARLIAYRDDCIRQLRAAYDVRSVSVDLLLADDEEKIREGLIDEERGIRIKHGLPPEGGIFT